MTAAVQVVQEAGWSAASTRVVAERAGVRPGVVHYHFSSVTDLLVDATVPTLVGFVDELVSLLEDADDLPTGIDALLGTAAGYAEGYAADDPAPRLAAEAFLAATRVPRLRDALAETLVRARARLADWLRSRGFDGDAPAVATLLAAALDGLILHRAVDPHTDLAGVARSLRLLVHEGRGRGTKPAGQE